MTARLAAVDFIVDGFELRAGVTTLGIGQPLVDANVNPKPDAFGFGRHVQKFNPEHDSSLRQWAFVPNAFAD